MYRSAVLVAATSVVSYTLFSALLYLDVYTHHHSHYPGKCRELPGPKFGSEAMAVSSGGLVVFTSGLPIQHVEQYYEASGTRSRILVINMHQIPFQVDEPEIHAAKDFDIHKMRPHGIDMIENKAGPGYFVYIINHPKGESTDRVEKFILLPDKNQLRHLQSFDLGAEYFTNDISLIGEDQFYISKYLPYRNQEFIRLILHLVPLRLGALSFYNSTGHTDVATGLLTPNGHCFSRDHRFLYVAMTMERALYVFKRDPDTNEVKMVQNVQLHSMPDNVQLSEDGSAVLVGGHPVYYKTLVHLSTGPENLAPSSVLNLPLNDEGLVVEDKITELLYDQGGLISGSSVAVIHSGHLLVGSVADNLLLCCLNDRKRSEFGCQV